MPHETIELNVKGKPCEVRAYASGEGVAIAFNTNKGCAWRGLISLDGTMLGFDATNTRAILAAALGKELSRMRYLYGCGGAIIGFGIASIAERLL